MKIAVIGSGAAALGVLDRLSEVEPRPEITLIDRAEFSVPATPPVTRWTHEELRFLYKKIKLERGMQFPPPKTNFGVAPKKQKVEDWGQVWDSNLCGGLTTIWGLCAVPFSHADFKGWPYGRVELDKHYAAIAKRVGIAGERDSLNQIIGEDFVNRPPVTMSPLIAEFRRKINSKSEGKLFRFTAGASRLAVETRPEKGNSCNACGECMVGCVRQSTYSTSQDIDRWRQSGLIARFVTGRVLAIERETRSIAVRAENHREIIGPFDRIYLCAGCIATTEIVMRTLAQKSGPQIVDNSAYTFGIIYMGRQLGGDHDSRRYFGSTNLLINATPLKPAGDAAQIQVYLLFDHLWRYFLPSGLWRAAAPLFRTLRGRILLGRIFLHGTHSQRYGMHVSGDQPASLSLAHAGTSLWEIPDLWFETKRALSGDGFAVPPLRPIRQRTGSHYAASLPLGRGPVAVNGSIAPGIFLCDSSVFPTAPAASPTFTIMANARYIAEQSLPYPGEWR